MGTLRSLMTPPLLSHRGLKGGVCPPLFVQFFWREGIKYKNKRENRA